MPTCISTTALAHWVPLPVTPSSAAPNLTFSPATDQTWEGFGGCFNELGWDALSLLSEPQRDAIFKELFHPTEGCRFTLCRLPIGASDYALEWYSHNETPNDFAMEHFSIARDHQYLIPYIQAAQAYQPNLQLFASPWSPPTWLKHPRAYNFGTLIWKPEYLRAYALYFLKFVQAYRAAGLPIAQVHVQNEPAADQKFPSCLWTGLQMRDFIRDYLAPLFKQHNEPAEIWFGTLNTDDYNKFPLTALIDPAAKAAIAGVGLQWAGKGMAQRLHQAFPNLRIMQTENECGDGKNSWDYAQYVFSLLQHYLTNGANAYIYWNMVLHPGGKSTWGWTQNAMITIDPDSKAVTYTPEFYVMKHFSHFILPGALRIPLTGPWAANAVAFQNPPAGPLPPQTIVVIHNPLPTAHPCTLNPQTALTLPPHSFNTLIL